MKELLKEAAKNAAVGISLVLFVVIGTISSANLEIDSLYFILASIFKVCQIAIPFLGILSLGKLARLGFDKAKSFFKRG